MESTFNTRQHLLDFCLASRDSKYRAMENLAASSPSSEQLDEALDCLQSEADKWHACLKWLRELS